MNRIRSLREEIGMTQKELAARLGAKGGAVISKYESERNALSDDTLKMLSLIFDVSVDYILGVSDSRKPGTSLIKPHMDWDALSLVESMNKLSADGRRSVFEYIRSSDVQEVADKFAQLSPRSKKKALDYLEMLKVMEETRAEDRQRE